MISTGILFGLGIQGLLNFLFHGDASIEWQWYIPLSIVFTGFCCSVPTFLLWYGDNVSQHRFIIRIIIHFIILYGVVAGFGKIFGWYDTTGGLMVISVMYVAIYLFVWVATSWLLKTDDKKINSALDEIRDKE